MPTLFAWLDYSEQERRRMQDTIQLFGERTTRDELGLGTIRDVFADLLFPGTSTIQTRAKYFLFVPWTYLLLEKKRVSSAEVADRARRIETDLITSLSLSNDHRGTIGRLARENVQRLASSVYWQGLMTWGIRTFDGSQDDYHRSLSSFYAHHSRHMNRKTEIDPESLGSPPGHWHSGLPPIPEDFPKNQEFVLSEEEATYLKQRILELCPDSLMAFLLRESRAFDDINHVWDFRDIPDEIQNWLNQGRIFARVMHGAPLLYNLLLSEQSHWVEQIKNYRELLHEWWSEVPSEAPEWQINELWDIIYGANPKIPRRTREFVEAWHGIVQSTHSAEELIENRNARRLIVNREFQLKGQLSRYTNTRTREIWAKGGGAAGTRLFDYRWGSASRLLSDIFQGLPVRN